MRTTRTNNSRGKRNETRAERLLGDIRDDQTTQIRGVASLVRDIEMPHLKRNKVYSFIKSYSTSITTSTTVDTSGSYPVNLTNCPEYASYVAIFDSWRIAAIEWTLVIYQGANVTQAPIYTVIDYDDSTNLTSQAAALEYDTVMITAGNAVHRRVYKPRVAVAAYAPSAFTSFAQGQQNQWIDTASAGVPFYGIKAYCAASGQAVTWSVNQRILYQFKNTK
jgi:hypothetical protein